MSHHAQNGSQLLSLAQGGLPVPVGYPDPVFSPRGLLIPPKLPHGSFGGIVELRLDWPGQVDHLQWLPELPFPPWPPSVCFVLEAPILLTYPCLS